MADQDDAPGMAAALRDNIETLRARRQREEQAQSAADRIADRITRFAGSMPFVALHLVLYGGWIAINLGLVPGVPRFDPSFVVLAMEASVEAIFLSTFVLISQNRMGRAADRRADLDLHVNLLAEHELTQLARLVRQMADRLGVADNDAALDEIGKDVRPAEVLDALEADHEPARS